jgi:predicted PurR-regulated permease PerM
MGFSLEKNDRMKLFVAMASLVIILAGIKAASTIVVPFLLSIFIAIMCNPLISKATQYRIPKPIAVIFVISVFVSVVLFLAGLIGNSLNELSLLIPQYREQLNEQFSWLAPLLTKYNIKISYGVLLEYLDPAAAMGFAAQLLSSFSAVMANMLLIILTVVFMLFEASSITLKLHVALDDPDMRQKQIERFIDSVNNYIAIKTLVSILTGCIVSFMLWAFGLDFFLLWGVLAFLFNYIPNIGSIIAAIPAVILATLQLGIGDAGFIALGNLSINMIMGNIIEPRYLGKGLGLSTLVVFLSLIFWGWLLGTVGMLLSVPLTMILKIGFENSPSGNWFSTFLSDEETVVELTKAANLKAQKDLEDLPLES